MKKIAFLSFHSDPLATPGSRESGGQNIYTFNLMKNLDKLGWSIDLFTRLDFRHKKLEVKLGKNSRVIRLPVGPLGYVPKEELQKFFPEALEKINSFIYKHRISYDLFYGHHYDGGWLGLKLKEKWQKPLVVTFHSLGKIRQATFLKHKKAERLNGLFLSRLQKEEEIVKEADLIISLSEEEKSQLINLYQAQAEKIFIVPPGLDIEHFRPVEKNQARETLHLPLDYFLVLYLGRLEWRKGLGTLIKSLSLLKEKISKVMLIIVGGKIFGAHKNPDDFAEYERLRQKAKEEGVGDLVKFVGQVPHQRVYLYLSAADVLAIPSYYEPFGLVALEGMASKTPVVASRVGGLKEIIQDGENGLLVEPYNPYELSEKIFLLFQNKELAKTLTEKAFNFVQTKFSWSEVAQKISQILISYFPSLAE